MKGRILLCVLDWGLGHATRSLALAKTLHAEQFEVIFASSGSALDLLKIEMPLAKFYVLPSYDVTYQFGGSFTQNIVRQLGKIRRVVKEEHRIIDQIVKSDRFDLIISDNRYGCFHPDVRSIFLSHHLKIRLTGGWKLLSGVVNAMHRKRITRFDECWVPDFPNRQLSGDLSELAVLNKRFIGPLSTMRRSSKQPKKKYSMLCILSGPEPQRTLFANALIKQLENVETSWLLVHGVPNGAPQDPRQRAFMTRDELNRVIEESDWVICRSGYSSIMDLAALGSKAFLVPTPGQTEQLYLADMLMERGVCFCQQQDKLDLRGAMEASRDYHGFLGADHPDDLLIQAIQSLSSQG
jgi:predicted glycosyltransferase